MNIDLMKKIINRSPIGIISINKDGEILDLNTSAKLLLKYKDSKTNICSYLKKPKNEPSLRELLFENINNIEKEHLIFLHENHYIEIDFENYEDISIIYLKNITSYIIKKKKYLRTKILQENILNSIPFKIVIINEHLEIITLNYLAEKSLDSYKTALIGRHFLDVFPEYKPKYHEIQKAISHQKKIILDKILFDTEDEQRYLKLSLFPLNVDVSKGAVVFIEDVTETVSLQENLLKSKKLSSLAGLTIGLAHEISNPLAGLIQNMNIIKLRLLEENTKNIEAAKECGITFDKLQQYLKIRNIDKLIACATNSGIRSSNIIENILNFGNIDKNSWSVIDIKKTLLESLEYIKKQFSEDDANYIDDITFNIQFPEENILIFCDKSKIKQSFSYLLKNAFQAFKEVDDNRQKIISLKISLENEIISLHIEDNGCGVPENILKNVFEPFFTTRSVGKGMGMGLFVAYFIIKELHDGQLNLESKENLGTKVEIKLRRYFEN